MKEIYKYKNDVCPLWTDMFEAGKTNCNLLHFLKEANTNKNSVKMGLETISYCAPQLWNLVPRDAKDASSA